MVHQAQAGVVQRQVIHLRHRAGQVPLQVRQRQEMTAAVVVAGKAAAQADLVEVNKLKME